MKSEKLPQGVLKIKKGFNPNSSSIGTVVFSFPVVLTAVGSALAALKIIVTKKKKDNEK